ncbi:protein O-mannosyl-transferase family [candidate division KSB1 bacterium]
MALFVHSDIGPEGSASTKKINTAFLDPGLAPDPDRLDSLLGRILPAAVFFLVMAGYLATTAPSVSFWDCGEFISVSWILGIPHPPGTPLYVLLGRLMGLLPLGGEIAFRINLMSALMGAVSAVLVLLVCVGVLRDMLPRSRSAWHVLSVWTGGLAAGLMWAFSFTNWNNSTEAEVYAISACLMALVVWIMMRWEPQADRPAGDRLLFLVLYLLALSIGNHLMTFLVAPGVFLFVLLKRRGRGLDFLAIGLGFFLSFNAFVYLMGSEAYGTVPITLALVVLAAVVFRFHGELDLKFILTGILLFWLGLLVHLYLPIRAVLDPAINEGDPATWQTFLDMINRKQYSPPPITQRQAPFGYQLEMFWDYFKIQWSDAWKAVLPLGLGLYGLWTQAKKGSRSLFAFIGVLFLICSLGLVIYINFKLAPNQALDRFPAGNTHHEVRERDYFYTPAYLFFAIWIGVGIGAFLAGTGNWLRNVRTSVWFRRLLIAGLVVVVASIISLPFRTYLHECDRSGNLVGHDYALNILNSTPSNGVIFTNGDNDTFPLWFLQEVKGVRRDVVVVNLSLLNTVWYIQQLRDRYGVIPASWSDEQIQRLRPTRYTSDISWKHRSIKVDIPKEQLVRGQDMAMLEILRQADFKRPVYFAVTVSESNMFGLLPHGVLEGLVYRIAPDSSSTDRYDDETCGRNLFDLYCYRGVFDEGVFKDSQSSKLMANYLQGHIRRLVSRLRAGKFKEAGPDLERALAVSLVTPNDEFSLRLLNQLVGIYQATGEYQGTIRVLQTGIRRFGERAEFSLGLGLSRYRLKDYQGAETALKRGAELAPDKADIFRVLFMTYRETGRADDAMVALNRWLELKPDDPLAKKLREDLLKGAPPPE